MARVTFTQQQLDDYRRRRLKAEHPEEYQRMLETEQTKADEKQEKQLQTTCENLLRLRGIEYLHLSFRAREKCGWPDLVFALPQGDDRPGIPMAVELKTARGRLSDDQVKVLTRMQANGWCVRIIRSFEDFKRLLDGDLLAGEKTIGRSQT